MKLVALMPLRNEEWICGLTIRAALIWCDSIVVGLHACEDRTPEIVGKILDEYPDRVWPIEIGDGPWDEMNHRQLLLDECRAQKATHVALVDADEILTGNFLVSIRSVIEQLTPCQVLQVSGHNIWESQFKIRVDGEHRNTSFSLAFRDSSGLSWQPRGTYQHHHRHPFGSKPSKVPTGLAAGVMHLQFIRERAFRAKQAHYEMMELVRWPEQGAEKIRRKYSWWFRLEKILYTVPASWWEPYRHLMKYADFSDDCETWHEREIHRLIAELGGEPFMGLDLFGMIGDKSQS